MASSTANFNWWMAHRSEHDFAAGTWILVDSCGVRMGPCASRSALVSTLIRSRTQTTQHHCILCVGSERPPPAVEYREIGEISVTRST